MSNVKADITIAAHTARGGNFAGRCGYGIRCIACTPKSRIQRSVASVTSGNYAGSILQGIERTLTDIINPEFTGTVFVHLPSHKLVEMAQGRYTKRHAFRLVFKRVDEEHNLQTDSTRSLARGAAALGIEEDTTEKEALR